MSSDVTFKEAFWGWVNEHGVVAPYTDENIALLEAARGRGDRRVRIESAHRAYEIDVVSMTHMNCDTHGTRKVVRKLVMHPDWLCPECATHNKGGFVLCSNTSCGHLRLGPVAPPSY